MDVRCLVTNVLTVKHQWVERLRGTGIWNVMTCRILFNLIRTSKEKVLNFFRNYEKMKHYLLSWRATWWQFRTHCGEFYHFSADDCHTCFWKLTCTGRKIKLIWLVCKPTWRWRKFLSYFHACSALIETLNISWAFRHCRLAKIWKFHASGHTAMSM